MRLLQQLINLMRKLRMSLYLAYITCNRRESIKYDVKGDKSSICHQLTPLIDIKLFHDKIMEENKEVQRNCLKVINVLLFGNTPIIDIFEAKEYLYICLINSLS